MKQDFKILLVEDSESFQESMIQLLGVYNDVEAVGDLASARTALARGSYEVVILDKTLPDGNGLDLIAEIKAERPTTVIIILTADGEINSARKCLAAGADEYVVKSESVIPDLLVRIPLAVTRAAEAWQLTSLKDHVANAFKYEIIGKSDSTRELRETVMALKGSKSHVLITGESGTGKELIAQRLYNIETEKQRMVMLNCSSFSENLIESELFGHKKGAFTGAMADKIGHIELANKGDLFLDEIADLPLPSQAKLLRVLQDGKFYRVGGTKPVEVDCRVIAATNKNLEEMVKRGQFREDLYYRLNVVRIRTIPLRQRKEDICGLANFLCLKTCGAKFGISEKALAVLVDHEWPGNIRELSNVIERAFIRAKQRDSKVLDRTDISIDQPDQSASFIKKLESLLPVTRDDIHESHYQAFMELAEREFMLSALKAMRGSATDLGPKLGMSKSTIFKRITALGIPRRNYTAGKDENSREQTIPSTLGTYS